MRVCFRCNLFLYAMPCHAASNLCLFPMLSTEYLRIYLPTYPPYLFINLRSQISSHTNEQPVRRVQYVKTALSRHRIFSPKRHSTTSMTDIHRFIPFSNLHTSAAQSLFVPVRSQSMVNP
ncbi:hypothetical protein BDV95DRAFT_180429 [Massariosphaeria phaeospora]|uniref:Secreted protein n=1 Tax=Massariosphaeria phaeospora TaxID=100035 RepID=A0A7C8M4G3_9PLEO|nr:hypothetical protein BDV95DRAFT_180429 [Massariosphaeria phaeospora]